MAAHLGVELKARRWELEVRQGFNGEASAGYGATLHRLQNMHSFCVV